ncbi:MAG: LPS assembly protein LptD [Candidatus Theseobacter exili]|nr:LPS assembly protein LptD [Candidatus Theseobacter exili]
MVKRIVFAGLICIGFILSAGYTFAQEGSATLPLTCDADKMDYDRENGIITGTGNVKIIYEDVTLEADKVTVVLETKDAYAEGNVRVTQGEKIITAEKMHYNFDTKQGDVDKPEGFVYPWYWKGDKVERHSPEFYEVHNCVLTTCEDCDNPKYHLKAKKVQIYPGNKLIARHVVLYFGKIPVFYLPIYSQSLKDEKSRWTVIPGNSDKWGTYLLSAYDWLLTEYVDSTLRLDYRHKRGLGVGVDVDYRIKKKDKQVGAGEVQTYYIDDDAYEPEGESARKKKRYKAELKHLQFITPTVKLRAEAHKLSDKDILRDFFRGEYDDDAQPSSYIDISKLSNNYLLSLYARKRLNDFYDVVERLPQLKLDARNQQIFETPFYYEGETSIVKLEKRFDEDDGINENYDSVRFDTYNLISYPKKYFGWLEVTPNIGTRQTFYSKGEDEEEDLWKGIFITGIDFSTKMFRIYDVENEKWNLNDLRHVIEPGIEYTYYHKPSVDYSSIYKFDSIDNIGYQNSFRLSLRNKLQTKRKKQIANLIDLWTYIDYYPKPDGYKYIDIDEDDDESELRKHFSNFFIDLQLRPLNGLQMDVEASIDLYDGLVDILNTDLSVYRNDLWNVSVGHRYRREDSSLLSYEINFKPSEIWNFKLYHRYEFETGDMEEQEYTIYKRLDCDWNTALTFRKTGDDAQVWMVFWLSAYPDITMSVGE